MDNEKLTEMVYNTDKTVSILCRDVDSIKSDLKEFKRDSKENMGRIDAKLDKLCNEPREDMRFWKRKILNYVVDAILVLAIIGIGVFAMQKSNETNKVIQEYQTIVKENAER